MDDRIRVVLADDHAVVRKGIRETFSFLVLSAYDLRKSA